MSPQSSNKSFAVSTLASEALISMREAGQEAAIVMERGLPVGIVTLASLGDYLATDQCEATVSDAMDYEAVHVKPRTGVEETMRAFRTAAWHSLDRRHPFASAKRAGS
jgi:CBS domain-containing protein